MGNAANNKVVLAAAHGKVELDGPQGPHQCYIQD